MATFLTGNTGRGSGPHLDFRVFDVNAGDYVNPTGFTDLLMVDGKPLTEQFRMTSGFGPRKAPVPGASTYHLGLDYATPTGTKVEVKGGKLISTYDGGSGGVMSQIGIMRDGKPYDILLLHGSENNPITSSGFKKDFDYSSLNNLIAATPARVNAKEIVNRYQTMGADSVGAAMKSPEPAVDIRNRDVSARDAFDPRFDKKP